MMKLLVMLGLILFAVSGAADGLAKGPAIDNYYINDGETYLIRMRQIRDTKQEEVLKNLAEVLGTVKLKYKVDPQTDGTIRLVFEKPLSGIELKVVTYAILGAFSPSDASSHSGGPATLQFKITPLLKNKITSEPPKPKIISTRGAVHQKIVVSKEDLAPFYKFDPNILYTAVRMVPNFKNGKELGMKVLLVQPGSVFDKLGFKKGDIWLGANGAKIEMKSFSQSPFPSAGQDKFTYVIERDGRKFVLDYEVR